QARPYPRRGSWMTCAPIRWASSAVPSVELLSTTMTSVTRLEGKSASTRPMACASLWGGMMTETRTQIRSSPPYRGGASACQQRIDAPGSTRASNRKSQGCEHRNQELPDPRGAPLRHPKAAKIQKSYECNGSRNQADDQQNSQRYLQHGLHG